MDSSKVTIYSAVWCGFCHQAKQYFDTMGIKYTDKDVEQDVTAGVEALAKSGQRGIPVIDIDGDIIVGFDRPRIDAALKAHNIA
jgi:glutaredoxin-like YruB-family protein